MARHKLVHEAARRRAQARDPLGAVAVDVNGDQIHVGDEVRVDGSYDTWEVVGFSQTPMDRVRLKYGYATSDDRVTIVFRKGKPFVSPSKGRTRRNPGAAHVHQLYDERGGKASYAWIITRDVIGEKWDEPGEESSVGTIGPQNATDANIKALRAGRGTKFRMYDDDNELYYEGLFIGDTTDEEFAFGPLDDYGAPNAGCTRLDYKVGRKWETL